MNRIIPRIRTVTKFVVTSVVIGGKEEEMGKLRNFILVLDRDKWKVVSQSDLYSA